jgi:type II secretory pathway component GspD/PulD (secretin)
LLTRPVTLDVWDEDARTVAGLIARSLDVELAERDGVWIIGRQQPGDLVVMSRTVRGRSAAEIGEAVRTVTNSSGKIATYPDGLLVVVDSAESVARVATLLDQIEATQRPQWAVQFYLVTLSQRDVSDLGLDVTPAVDIAVAQAAGSAAGVPSAQLQASLRAVLRAAAERSSVAITAQPSFLLLDGESAEFNKATRILIPKTSINTPAGGGQQQVLDYESVNVGTIVKVKIREVAADALRLDASIELSDVVEINSQGIPRTDVRSWSGPCSVTSGGTYLLTSIEIGQKRRGRGSWLHAGWLDDDSQEVLQVWCRCEAVSGPVVPSAVEG